jgi:SNF2 family DNA or RNA helicase
MEPEPVELKEWQIDWAAKVKKILKKNEGYIDTSPMRTGKTYVTLWIAQQLNLKLLVVCPVTAMGVWESAAEAYNIEMIGTISYQSLRSTEEKQPKHGFLQRIDEEKTTDFIVTQKYLDSLQEGILLVFDEFQNIKNNSTQYKASSALINALVQSETDSKYALLSGTPFDREKHSVNLLKMIGYINSKNLYKIDKKTGEIILQGIQELIDRCMSINAKMTTKILKKTPPTEKNFDILAYELYVNVIKNEISGAMVAPDIESEFDVKNGFFSINKNSVKELEAGIAMLDKAVKYVKYEKLEVGDTPKNMGKVTIALRTIENAKAIDMARVANDSLNYNKNLKVVISVNYTTTIEIIQEILAEWNPLILNGKIKGKKRGKIVKTFMDDPEQRVFIMNTAVGGVGISLYSQDSNEDRLMLISPSYKVIEMIQAASRIYGPGMKSEAKIRIFYGDCSGCDERGILASLVKKTLVLKGTLDANIILKLPGDYESVTEKTFSMRNLKNVKNKFLKKIGF